MVKEFSEMSPILLAVVSDAPESNSIEVMKHLLEKGGVNCASVDFNKNTILHLAVKHKKLQIIKYFQDILTPFLLEANKEGHTPFAIAQESNFSEIQSFLNSIAENPENNRILEEELNELIEATNQQKNKKKKKGNKKNAKDEVRLLNSAGFQETLKIKQPTAAAEKQKVISQSGNAVNIKEKEEIEETGDVIIINRDNNKNNYNGKSFSRDADLGGKPVKAAEDPRRGKSSTEAAYNAEYEQGGDWYNHNVTAAITERNTNNKRNNTNNNNNNQQKQRGYRYNEDQQDYAENGYQQQNYDYEEDYQYADRYVNSNPYNMGYNPAPYKGRYGGYQNYDRANNGGKYYRNDRDFRYNNRDYTKGGASAKSYEKAEVIEKPLKYEEKILGAEADKTLLITASNEKNTNKNSNNNSQNNNTTNIVANSKEEINVKNNINTNTNVNNTNNNPNISNNENKEFKNFSTNNAEKEKEKVVKEKKIIGLDAKTLKKIEKKDKKAKGPEATAATTRKLSKDELNENEKEKEAVHSRSEKAEEKQKTEVFLEVTKAEEVTHTKAQGEAQKPHVDFEAERNQDTNLERKEEVENTNTNNNTNSNINTNTACAATGSVVVEEVSTNQESIKENLESAVGNRVEELVLLLGLKTLSLN